VPGNNHSTDRARKTDGSAGSDDGSAYGGGGNGDGGRQVGGDMPGTVQTERAK
jgi:hypothetical protein